MYPDLMALTVICRAVPAGFVAPVHIAERVQAEEAHCLRDEGIELVEHGPYRDVSMRGSLRRGAVDHHSASRPVKARVQCAMRAVRAVDDGLPFSAVIEEAGAVLGLPCLRICVLVILVGEVSVVFLPDFICPLNKLGPALKHAWRGDFQLLGIMGIHFEKAAPYVLEQVNDVGVLDNVPVTC